MGIEEIKNKIINDLGGDPLGDPTSWDLIEKKIKKQYWSFLIDRSGAAKFLEFLPTIFPSEKFSDDSEAQVCWERIAIQAIQGTHYLIWPFWITVYLKNLNRCWIVS